jgi:hypothetical protein
MFSALAFQQTSIITRGLGINIDASDRTSYPGSGTYWYDLSGNSFGGSVINGPTFSSTNGGFFNFDGVDDYINFLSSPTLTNQMTSEIWVNLNAVNGIQNVFGKQTGGNDAYRLLAFYNYPGIPDQLTWVCATTNNPWYSAGTFIDYPTTITGWKQVVGVYDGTKNLLYINGQLAISGSAISGNIITSAGTLALMTNQGVGGLIYAQGKTGVFRQYTRALTSSEINQNFNATRARFGI